MSASKLELKRCCPGYEHLPHSDVRTADAEAGVDRHAVWEEEIGRGVIPEELDERWPGCAWRSEVPFALDLATGKGRELPRGNGHRDYSMATPFEVCGTADVVGLLSNTVTVFGERKLVIVDRKSFEKVPAARDNLQTGIAAIALSRALGIDNVDVGIYYEAAPFDVATLDTFDLDAMAQEIKRIVTHPSREVTEGPWCKFCPAQESCPRKVSLAIELASGAADNRIDLLNLHDDEVAADAYEFAGKVRMLLRRLDARIYARAGERPFAIADGKMFGKVVKAGDRELDGRKAHEVLLALHGLEVADEAVTMEVTQSGIEKALKGALPRGAVSSAKAKVLARLDEAGGVTRKERVVVEEYEATPMLKAGAK